MTAIVFPTGDSLSSTGGEFCFPRRVGLISSMKTVEETRRSRLQMLVDKYNGMANLCEHLGYARNETAGLTRILHANLRHDRDGEPYDMGSKKAREIETKLGLSTGWMDSPPDLIGDCLPEALRNQLGQAMAVMDPQAQYMVVKMVTAMAATPTQQPSTGPDFIPWTNKTT